MWASVLQTGFHGILQELDGLLREVKEQEKFTQTTLEHNQLFILRLEHCSQPWKLSLQIPETQQRLNVDHLILQAVLKSGSMEAS